MGVDAILWFYMPRIWLHILPRLRNKNAPPLRLVQLHRSEGVCSLLVCSWFTRHPQTKPNGLLWLLVTVDQDESCCIVLAGCCSRTGVRVSKRRSFSSLPKHFPGSTYDPFQHRLPTQPLQSRPQSLCVSQWYYRLLLLSRSNIPV